MNTLAKRLRYALDLREISGNALARKIGLDKGYISKLRSGDKPGELLYATAVKMARALDVDVEWLMEGVGPTPTREDQIDVLPRRALAVQIAREGGIHEQAIEAVMARPIAPEADRVSTLGWILSMQAEAASVAAAPAPPTPPTRSHARPRADTLPPTRRSTPIKK